MELALQQNQTIVVSKHKTMYEIYDLECMTGMLNTVQLD